MKTVGASRWHPPAFVKSEQQFYFGSPIWRIELASPVWPKTSRAFN